MVRKVFNVDISSTGLLFSVPLHQLTTNECTYSSSGITFLLLVNQVKVYKQNKRTTALGPISDILDTHPITSPNSNTHTT